MSCRLRHLRRRLITGRLIMPQNPGARDGTDTAVGRMDLPSIRGPAIFERLMVDGTFAIEDNGRDRRRSEAAAEELAAAKEREGRPPKRAAIGGTQILRLILATRETQPCGRNQSGS